MFFFDAETIQNGRMILLNCSAMAGNECGEFSGEMRGDLPRGAMLAGLRAAHIRDADVAIIGHNFLNLIDGDRGAGFLRKAQQ